MSLIQKGFFIIIGIVILSSCDTDPFEIDVNEIELTQTHLRVDKVLMDGASIQQSHMELFNSYPIIYGTYFQNILQLGQVDESAAHENIQGFLRDPMMSDINHQVDSCYPQGNILKNDFIDAFKHYKYYFPEDTIPNIAFYNSGFNYGIYPMPTFIGIGLEWYLGVENKLLERLPPAQFPKYLKNKMDDKYMVADAIRGWLLVKNTDKIEGKQMIDQLIYFGKIAYLVKACLPEEEDYIKFGYQPKQYEWCAQNEFLIWKTLLVEDMLFTKDSRTINSFIGNAPFTKGFSSDSPGKLAFFIGYNMVEDYMKANDTISLKEMLEVDAKQIMNAYRPKD